MSQQNLKIIIFASLFFVFILGPSFVLAQKLEISYPPLPFLNVETPNEFMPKISQGIYPSDQALPLYVKYFYYLILSLSGLIAFGAIVYGGFKYLISFGAPVKMIIARDQILGGVLGLIILLSSYLILTAINPQLAVFGTSKEMADVPAPQYYRTCLRGSCVLVPGSGEDECKGDYHCPSEIPPYREIPLGRMVEWVIKRSAEAEEAAKKVKEASQGLENLTAELKELLKECDCKYSCPDCVGCPPACSDQEEGCGDFASFENCYINQSKIDCAARQYYQGPCDSSGCFCTECVGGLKVAETGRPSGNLGKQINVRDYFFPAGAPGVNISSGEYFKPLLGQGTGSTHGRTPARYQKSHDLSYFEDFGFDNSFIYHYRDTTWATGPNQNVKCAGTNDEAYFTLMEGHYGSHRNTCPSWDPNKEGVRWIPSSMKVGESFSTLTTVVGFNKKSGACCDTDYTGLGHHGVSLQYQGCIKFPNEIVREDVIMVYTATHNETGFYDKDLGWIGFYWGDDPESGNYLTDYEYSQIVEGECLDLKTGGGIQFAYSPCDPCPNRREITRKQNDILRHLISYQRLIFELSIARYNLANELLNLELAEALMRDSITPVLSYDQLWAIDLKEVNIKKINRWAYVDYKDNPNTPEYEDMEDPTTFYLFETGNEDLIEIVESMVGEGIISPPSACLPGQEIPHRICHGNNCTEIYSCGVSTCQFDANCPLSLPENCLPPMSWPYKICDGSTCREIQSCGVSTCQANDQCAAAPSVFVQGINPLFQRDGRWKEKRIDFCANPPVDFGGWGCGPTSLAIILRKFGQTTITPVNIAGDDSNPPLKTNLTGDSWETMEFHCNSGSVLPNLLKRGSDFGVSYQAISAQQIREQLSLGRPIIAHCSNYSYWGSGHYTVIYGIDEQDNIYFMDTVQGQKTYSWSQVTDDFGCWRFWSFYD